MNVYMSQYKMLKYDRIDISEGIDVNNKNKSRMYALSLLVFFR